MMAIAIETQDSIKKPIFGLGSWQIQNDVDHMNTNSHRHGIHIGIIPDGSRRWAEKNKIKNYDGSQSGDVVETIVTHIFKKYNDVTDISVWALSTENMKRPQEQKEHIYKILEREFNTLKEKQIIYKRGIKVNVIGSRFGEVPEKVRNIVLDVLDKTKDHHKGRNLNICIGYGGKEEILEAVMASSKWLRKNPTMAKMHEGVFEKFLMMPKPLDIVIRTGGEKRLSGFMLYQIEYAELFFIDTLWPDFTTKEVDKIMKEFNERRRRFGR